MTDLLDFLTSDDPTLTSLSFPLKTAGNLTVLIPYTTFRRAYQREGKHVVTLANGQELEGLLEGTLIDSRPAENLTYEPLRASSCSVFRSGRKPILLRRIQQSLDTQSPSWGDPLMSFPIPVCVRLQHARGNVIGEAEVADITTTFYVDDGLHPLLENPSGFADLTNYAEIVLSSSSVIPRQKSRRRPAAATR